MTSKTCNNVPYASMHFDGFCCHLSHPPPQTAKATKLSSGRAPPPSFGCQTKPRHLSHKLQILVLERACIPTPLSYNALSDSGPSFSANLNLQIRLAELRRTTPPGLHSTPGYRPSVCCHSSHSPQASIVSGEKAPPATQATPRSCK
jgi:hypothetical protein